MKTILITGATAGFGEAAARRFVQGGWRVVGTGRRGDRLRSLQGPFVELFLQELNHILQIRPIRGRDDLQLVE